METYLKIRCAAHLYIPQGNRVDFDHYKKYCTHQNAFCWTTDSFGRGRAGITSI